MHKGETNDNSLVKLKTIIYFHMTEEEEDEKKETVAFTSERDPFVFNVFSSSKRMLL